MNEISNKLGNEAREVYQEIFIHLSSGTYRIWYGQGQKSGSIFYLYEDRAKSHDSLNKRPSFSWEKLKTVEARNNFYDYWIGQ
jgi:hypothetical protein